MFCEYLQNASESISEHLFFKHFLGHGGVPSVSCHVCRPPSSLQFLAATIWEFHMAESDLPFQALPADHSTEEDDKHLIWYVHLIIRNQCLSLECFLHHLQLLAIFITRIHRTLTTHNMAIDTDT